MSKYILSGKIYDTETAELIASKHGLLEHWYLYRTQKGNWFSTHETMASNIVKAETRESAKEFVDGCKDFSLEKYLQYFPETEEA